MAIVHAKGDQQQAVLLTGRMRAKIIVQHCLLASLFMQTCSAFDTSGTGIAALRVRGRTRVAASHKAVYTPHLALYSALDTWRCVSFNFDDFRGSTRGTDVFRPPKIESWNSMVRTTRRLVRASILGTRFALQTSWWCFPLILTLIPPYFFLVLGEAPTTPSWWPLQQVFDDMRPEYIALFLLSNSAYYASSAVLFRDRRRGVPHPLMLPWLTLVAGLASTVYHYYQSMGVTVAAEALAYVDHGIAISAGFYFLRKCGFPRLGTSVLGISGLSLFKFRGDQYPASHSLWHIVSALTIISWANDLVAKRKKYIARELSSKREGK